MLLVANVASGAALLSKGPPSQRSSSPPVVTIIASEYAFDAPDTIRYGPTTIHLVSRGRKQHLVQLDRIEGGHSFADFKRALGRPGKTAWVTEVGGVGTLEPGASASTTLDLAPGLYAMFCDMEDAEGTPHMVEGMVRALTVSRTRNTAVMPVADVRLSLTEYAFTLPAHLHAGPHVVEVRNAGMQTHMALLWRLHRGMTASDVVHWIDAPANDVPPAPVTLVGGMPDLDPGQAAQIVARLDPGHYLLICLVDDIHGHTAHYAHGMLREVTVE